MIEIFIICLLLGTVVGVLSGLFGIGGGIIIVPILYSILPLLSKELMFDSLFQLVVGTSMATIVVTSLFNMKNHYYLNNIDWKIVRLFFIPLLVGTFLGATISLLIETKVIETLFALFLILLAINTWFSIQYQANKQLNHSITTYIIPLIIGACSSLFGLGGGIFMTPILLAYNVDIKKAIGTSVTLSIPVSISGTSSYIYYGLLDDALPDHTIGYIYIPAFLGIICTSSIFSKVGIMIADKMDKKQLSRLFSLILIISAIKIIIT